VKRPQSLALIGAAIIATCWLSFFLAVALHQDPGPTGGPVSPSQERLSRWFAVAWLVLGIIAFIPAIAAAVYAQSRFERGLAFGVLAASTAMPLILYILVASGYFADYS
jgi:hypothetical protein